MYMYAYLRIVVRSLPIRQGAWKPSLNLPTVLSSIQLLMSHPNPDDGLMLDIVRSARPAWCRGHSQLAVGEGTRGRVGTRLCRDPAPMSAQPRVLL